MTIGFTAHTAAHFRLLVTDGRVIAIGYARERPACHEYFNHSSTALRRTAKTGPIVAVFFTKDWLSNRG